MIRKIAITGALGHIGSKIIHSSFSDMHGLEEIRLVDNLLTQRYASLFNLPKGIQYNFYNADINSIDLNLLFKDIDVVIHLAAITDAASSFGNEEQIELVNIEGTNNVINACIKNRCKLIFPSSTSIYGSNKLRVSESSGQEDINPQSPYAESKYKSELILKERAKNGDISFCILRLGTIFGPSIGMRFHTAVNKFCWQANFNMPITVWETALKQLRPYLGINDAVEAIKFCLKQDLFRNEIFNVVSHNFSVNDVLKSLQKNFDNLEIDLVKNKIMNSFSYGVSSSKLEELGFKFEDKFEKQISETLQLIQGSSLKNLKDV